jgi:2-phosphoglycerate kinase
VLAESRNTLTGSTRSVGVQTYVATRARREHVPVVDNVNVERTVVQILEIILDAAGRSATCRDAPRA